MQVVPFLCKSDLLCKAAPGTIFHGNSPLEKTAQWSIDEQNKIVLNVIINHPWLGIVDCTYRPDPALSDHLRDWCEGLFSYRDESGRWHREVTPALFSIMKARNLFFSGVEEAIKDALEGLLVEVKNQIGIETHSDPESIRTSQVTQMLDVRNKLAKKRMGVKRGPHKSDREGLLSRYRELHHFCKELKKCYDVSHKKYTKSVHAYDGKNWRLKWNQESKILYPHCPEQVMDQCSNIDKELSSPSALAELYLAIECDLSPGYIHNLLKKERRASRQNSK